MKNSCNIFLLLHFDSFSLQSKRNLLNFCNEQPTLFATVEPQLINIIYDTRIKYRVTFYHSPIPCFNSEYFSFLQVLCLLYFLGSCFLQVDLQTRQSNQKIPSSQPTVVLTSKRIVCYIDSYLLIIKKMLNCLQRQTSIHSSSVLVFHFSISLLCVVDVYLFLIVNL